MNSEKLPEWQFEDEKNSSEFFEIRKVHQNHEDEKNSSEFFEAGFVRSKNATAFFSCLMSDEIRRPQERQKKEEDINRKKRKKSVLVHHGFINPGIRGDFTCLEMNADLAGCTLR